MAYINRQQNIDSVLAVCRTNDVKQIRLFFKSSQIVGGVELAEISDDKAFLKALARALGARIELATARVAIIELLNK